MTYIILGVGFNAGQRNQDATGMAKLTDPEILLCYRNALRNWRYEGFVVFEKDAAEGLRKHLDGVGGVAKSQSRKSHVSSRIASEIANQVVAQNPPTLRV